MAWLAHRGQVAYSQDNRNWHVTVIRIPGDTHKVGSRGPGRGRQRQRDRERERERETEVFSALCEVSCDTPQVITSVQWLTQVGPTYTQ